MSRGQRLQAPGFSTHFLLVNKLKAAPLLLEPTFDLVPSTSQGEALGSKTSALLFARVQSCRDPETIDLSGHLPTTLHPPQQC